ncbi:FkbM family methyltransferase [Vibrio sp. 10N.261.51.A4]|uniref:FkbM family methyltransferase n=1 Tax=Vibrio sp. 10N.261.51.A4 TaxID=3229674 RepID=UPI0035541841
MKLISYSQNAEDIMLWRALRDIENGFYIDVGANHPSHDSVTKLFYDRGWTGVNVEPEEECFNSLMKERTRDLNLNRAITSSGDKVEFYISSVRGWSTTDKDSLNNLEQKDAFTRKQVVNAISLDELMSQLEVEDVHFMKVDVEGAEYDVLQSYSFENKRPWIILIEATKPTTQIDTSNIWEWLLIENNYSCVYFDGLNKYYVAKEHDIISDKFKVPVNLFDDYIRSDHYSVIMDNKKMLEKLNRMEVDQIKMDTDKNNIKMLEQELYMVSTSLDKLHTKHDKLEADLLAINSNLERIHSKRDLLQWFLFGLNAVRAKLFALCKFIFSSIKSPVFAKTLLKTKVTSYANQFVSFARREVEKRQKQRHYLYTKLPFVYKISSKVYFFLRKVYRKYIKHPSINTTATVMSPRAQKIYNDLVISGKK